MFTEDTRDAVQLMRTMAEELIERYDMEYYERLGDDGQSLSVRKGMLYITFFL